MNSENIPANSTACLVLADGASFFGEGIGAEKYTIGEICFNTGLVGYQETISDPSYSGQIIVFTFPHIGNVGCNSEDIEAKKVFASGIVIRERITEPSNFRSEISLSDWLVKNEIGGICGVDTRALTRHIRKHGAQNAMIFRINKEDFANQLEEALDELNRFPNMKGLELSKTVTTDKIYEWKGGEWNRQVPATSHHVVAVDYGAKQNILRCLTSRGCKVTVVPAATSAEEILSLKPDGV